MSPRRSHTRLRRRWPVLALAAADGRHNRSQSQLAERSSKGGSLAGQSSDCRPADRIGRRVNARVAETVSGTILATARGSLHHGDCLTLIPKLGERAGPFDLVYLDPPFNAGGTRHARSGRG